MNNFNKEKPMTFKKNSLSILLIKWIVCCFLFFSSQIYAELEYDVVVQNTDLNVYDKVEVFNITLSKSESSTAGSDILDQLTFESSGTFDLSDNFYQIFIYQDADADGVYSAEDILIDSSDSSINYNNYVFNSLNINAVNETLFVVLYPDINSIGKTSTLTLVSATDSDGNEVAIDTVANFNVLSTTLCQKNDPADWGDFYEIGFITPRNYTLEVGLGFTDTFSPDEIDVWYDSTDTTCLSPIGYHAHNGDSTDYSSGEIEYNFSLNETGLSTFSYVILRTSSSQWYSDWTTVTKYIQFNDSYDIDFDASATDNDPFDGFSQNDTSYIYNTMTLGSIELPCQRISKAYDLSGTQYTEDYERSSDETSWISEITFKDINGDACILTVSLSSGATFYAEVYLDEEQITIDTAAETFTPNIKFELYRDQSHFGDPSKLAAYVYSSMSGFYFHDQNDSFIE